VKSKGRDMKEIRVGLVGWGTVGDSVAGLLRQQEDLISERTGVRVRLARVADLDLESPRTHPLPKDLLTDDFRQILDDPGIGIVIELVGGTTIAKDILVQAMEKGKHVVTANKALLAEDGTDVFETARKKGASIGFEASVCGGIPLLASIRRGLVGNRIRGVVGIVNGTTNYILTKMAREGQSYEEALREAQDLGFAEMEPSLDVEGWDACHKLVLLTLLAYGRRVPMESVPREGITHVAVQDVAYACELGYVIKLLATARSGEEGLEMGVCPTMVPKTHPLASVDGAYNAVQLTGDWVGRTLFYGLGAGGPATASAVVSDVVAIACKLAGKGGDDLLAPSWDEERPRLCTRRAAEAATTCGSPWWTGRGCWDSSQRFTGRRTSASLPSSRRKSGKWFEW